MRRGGEEQRWPGISRPVAIPAWAKRRARRNRERLAALVQPETKVRVDVTASIDWRSLCQFDANRLDIKVDWTLVELVGLAGMLAEGGIRDQAVAGTFDDIFLSAEFNKYEAAQTILIGEIQRLLCWRSIQHDNHHAAMFFHRRFMNYCAQNHAAIQSYVGILRGAEASGGGVIDFLIGHEFGHFCIAHPERLSESGERFGKPMTFGPDTERREFVEGISREQVEFEHYQELVGNPAHAALVEELSCDSLGLGYLLGGCETFDAEALDRFVDYARVVHFTGMMAYLEATLFDDGDGDADDLGTMDDIALLHSVRAYFLIRNHLLMVTCMTVANAPEALDRLIEVQKRVEDFIAWLDRALGTFIDKVVYWRFDLKDLGPQSFWMSDEQDMVLDHLRRYPNFTAEDYALARRIEAQSPRGWTVTED